MPGDAVKNIIFSSSCQFIVMCWDGEVTSDQLVLKVILNGLVIIVWSHFAFEWFNIKLPQGNGIRNVKVFNGKKQGSHHEQPPWEKILGQRSSIFMVWKRKKHESREKEAGTPWRQKNIRKNHNMFISMQMFETIEHRRSSIVLSLALPENQQIALQNWQFGIWKTIYFHFGAFQGLFSMALAVRFREATPRKIQHGTSKVTHFLKENHVPNLQCTRESRLLLKATLLHKSGCLDVMWTGDVTDVG